MSAQKRIRQGRLALASLLVLLTPLGSPSPSHSGAYVFSGEANGIDVVTHPAGYFGTGGIVTVSVCIDPTSVNAAQMVAPLQNIVATYNQLLPTTGNLVLGGANNVPATGIDFESVALHEIGHCLGMAHANLASESGLGEPDANYTKSTDGADNLFNIDPGPDLVIGSPDDLRGDDVNLHWFRTSNNNPFTIDSPVDSTTYARDTAFLPGPDTFAANADRTVGAVFFGVPDSEAVMQQLTFTDEAQRTLNHDDVATLRYAMSGLDELAGTGDDYTVQLVYAGLTTACDVVLDFDNAQTGFAVCLASGLFIGPDHLSITSANIFFNDSFNWFFNTATACQETENLSADQWKMVSLPCDTGGTDTVQDVFGDDLDPLDYGVRWGIFERDEAAQSNRLLDLADGLNEGEGYWIKTLDPGQSVSVDGLFNLPMEVALVSDAVSGRQNLVGHPFDFDVCWADVEVIDGPSTLTLDQADPLIGPLRACSMVPPDPSCVMSRIANKWNGAAYEPFDGETPGMEGTLLPFDGLWVKAFRPGISLRVPANAAVDCSLCTPDPVADAGPDRFTCSGDPVMLGTAAQPGHTYSWAPGGETTAQITVTPLVTTTYTVNATTACGSVQDTVTVWVDDGTDGLDEDFEGDVSGWATTGLWHLTDGSACPAPEPGFSSPTHAFYYGQDATCNYDTGAANSGQLISPLITGITPASELSFEYLRVAEEGGGFDVLSVDVVTVSGPTNVFSVTFNPTTWTSSGPISLAAFAGQNIEIHFTFDTLDSIANDTLGLFLDDVVVTTGGPPCGSSCSDVTEDFESGAPGWTASGLWHASASSLCPAPEAGYSSPFTSFYYGDEATCNYDTGLANSGELTSPLIGPINATSELSFMYLRDAEFGGFDATTVDVIDEMGVPVPLVDLQTNTLTWASSGPFSLATFAGQNIQLRFGFDTGDGVANGTLGWLVDDVTVTCVGGAGCSDPSDDFEGDVSGWTATGFWHLADNSPCPVPPGASSPTHAFYYGQDGLCTFDDGLTNSGTLTSPVITGITAASELSFMFQRDAENIGVPIDASLVEIVTVGGPTTVLDLSATNTVGWTASGAISLALFAGQDIQIRFNFDSFDSVGNFGFGWLVDDVLITGGTPCLKSLSGTKPVPALAAAEEPGAVKSPAVKSPPGHDPRNWFVRLSVVSADLRDDDNVLGQLWDASDEFDHHDLPELAPFGDRYLSIVFPHEDWGDFAGDYTADFHAPDPPLKGEWRFDVIGVGMGREVTLSWEEQGTPLRGWWLVDEETGERIRIVPGGSYNFPMASGTRRSFLWVHGNGNGNGKP